MLRSPSFRRPMARLALLAILLLALVPTLGRIAQAQASGLDGDAYWAAMCTMQGLQPAPDAPLAPAPRPSSDCDYCPLLGATITPAVATLSVAPLPPPAGLCTSIPAAIPAAPHPCGLGSRGPPVAS